MLISKFLKVIVRPLLKNHKVHLKRILGVWVSIISHNFKIDSTVNSVCGNFFSFTVESLSHWQHVHMAAGNVKLKRLLA